MVRFELRSAETHAGPGSASPLGPPLRLVDVPLNLPTVTQQNGRALSPAFAV